MAELDRLRKLDDELNYEQRCIHVQISQLNSRLQEIFNERQALIEQIGMIVIDGTYTHTGE